MYLTICTATFNRKKTLIRLYKSLCTQTRKDFEWLIVDDGSEDGTWEYLEHIYREEHKFTINIYSQVNQGKHVAINKGIDEAKGDLFFIVDSDDYLPKDSVDMIYCLFDSLQGRKGYVGISGLKAYSNDKLVGKTYVGEFFLDVTNIQRTSYGIFGDRAEAYYTDILKKHKFPVYENEKFVSEAIVWNKIAYEGGKLRFFNKIIYYCEYQNDGLSNNVERAFLNSWLGYSAYVQQEMLYRKSVIRKITLLYYYCRLAKYKKHLSCKDVSYYLNINKINKKCLLSIIYHTTRLYTWIYERRNILNKE